MDPALTEILLRADESVGDPDVEAIIRLRRPGLSIPGVRVVAQFGSIATCRLRTSDISDVWAHPEVISLKAPRAVGADEFDANPTIDRVPRRRNDVRRPTGLPLDGSGVVVCAVDWGLDVDHPNFKNPDGTTRILALWDQATDTGDSPAPYGYGTVHTRDDIDAALLGGNPYETLGYHPARADRGGGSHGTHVLDIAAGNGRAGGPVGLAPRADLVCVDLADRDTGGTADLGGSVRLCEAVDFCARVAGSRPFVINLSIGRHGGPHDGKTLVEMAFDELLRAAPGRFIVQSTGNYYRAGTHTSGVLAPGRSRTFQFVVDPDDVTDNELEIWYGGSDEFSVRFDPPGAIGPVVPLGSRADVVVGGRLLGRVHHRAHDPNNGDNHVDAFLYEPGPAGVWTVTLYAAVATSGRFDAWLERDEKCRGCQARFVTPNRDPASTTGTIANGHVPLVVGAYDAHQFSRPAARFSSAGPTRDGRCKPDLAAPGVDELAARSAGAGDRRSPGGYTRKSGSSMATPHVTGAVALCLQAAGHGVTAEQIRALVLQTVDPAEGDRARLGHGYLDVAALVTAVWPRQLGPREWTMNVEHGVDVTLRLAPATAYREMLYRPTGLLSSATRVRYQIVGRPGRTPTAKPRAGDVLLTADLGTPEGGRCDVLVDGRLTRRRAQQGGRSGWYGTVLDGSSLGLARQGRILDTTRCLPPGALLLRQRHPTDPTDALPGWSDAASEETTAGQCPDTVVAAGDRPALLLRGSVHPAVRDAQRRINAIHESRLRTARPGLDGAPLIEDCNFGGQTERAVRAFQRLAFPGQPTEQDGKLGPHTWAALDQFAPAPPQPTPPPPPIPPLPTVEARAALAVRGDLEPVATGSAVQALTGGVVGRPGLRAKPGAIRVKWAGGLAVSLRNLIRTKKSEAEAAQIIVSLLADPSAYYTAADGQVVARRAFESTAQQDGAFVLMEGMVALLVEKSGLTRAAIEEGGRDEEQFGALLDTAARWRFFGADEGRSSSPKQEARERGRDRDRGCEVKGNLTVLTVPALATLYLRLLREYGGVAIPNDLTANAAREGLSRVDVGRLVGASHGGAAITGLFTQAACDGVPALGAPLADLGRSAQFSAVVTTLLEQFTWGNPTVARNEVRLRAGGLPERMPGLVFVDGTLYYDVGGNPLRTFAGEGFRDPGFQGAPRRGAWYNLIDLEAIADPEVREFFRLLKHQVGDSTALMFRGAAALYENFGPVTELVLKDLDTEVRDQLGQALKTMAFFLVAKAAIMAAERSNVPALQIIGATADGLLAAGQLLLDVDFHGSTVALLVSAGRHLCRVHKDAKGEYTPASTFEMVAAAEIIRSMLAMVIGRKLTDAVRERISRTATGEPARLRCNHCVLEVAPSRWAEEHLQDFYEGAVTAKAPTGSTGRPLTSGQPYRPPAYPGLVVHPNGNTFGPHDQVGRMLRTAKLTGRQRKEGEGYVVQSHHILEDTIAKKFGVTRDSGRCAALDADDHLRFGRYMSEDGSFRKIDDIWVAYAAHQEMYQHLGNKELLPELKRSILEQKATILAHYEAGRVPGGPKRGQPGWEQRLAKARKFLAQF